VFSFRYLPLLENINEATPDYQSMQEFLLFRYMLGNKTFTNEIKQSGPASILQYDISNKKIEKKQYWKFYYNEQQDLSLRDPDILNQTHNLWQSAVEKTIKGQHPILIPLSGGKDSRAILAAALEITSADNIITFSYGTKHSYDLQIAKKVAKKAGVKNIIIPEEKQNSSKLFEQTFYQHEGLFNAIPSLPFNGFENISSYGNTIISGYIGDYIFGSNMHESMINQYLDKKTDIQKAQHQFYKAGLFNNPDNVQQCLNYTAINNSEKLIDPEEIYSIPGKQLVNKFVQFFLQNHIYNFTYHTCMVHKELFQYKAPFLDNNLVDFTLQLPHTLRHNQVLYKRFLKQYYPKLFNIPIKNNYGLKMNAPKWKKQLKYNYYIKTIWRMNRLSSLLLREDIIPDKTGNYINYGSLLRQNSDLKKFVKKEIYNNLNSNFFNVEKINQLFREHQTNWTNHSTLLSQIVTLNRFIQKFLK
jgi:asparagine synthase (glutamine-hydrolysing)